MTATSSMTITSEHINGGDASASSYTVADLLAKVQQLVIECNYDLAKQFCDRSLQLEPNNADALEATGAVTMELGDMDQAQNYLLKAVEASPNKGPNKYLYLGQLTTELESISHYEKGVELLNGEFIAAQNAGQTTEADVIRRRISSALCSMTEIYLTDLCFEEDAESRCETYLSKAVEIDPENPEPHQLIASVRLSQGREEDAVKCLSHSMSLWKDTYALGDVLYPPFGTRISLVRLLLEVADLDTAESVLEDLQSEDDENIEVWYLSGWARIIGATEPETDVKNMEMLVEARECLKTCAKLIEREGCDDEGIRDHVSELLMQLEGEGLPPIQDDDEAEAEGDDADEAEWLDEEDDDIEMK